MKALLLLATTLLLGPSSHAGLARMRHVIGALVDFDAAHITLKDRGGKVWSLPRRYLNVSVELRPGVWVSVWAPVTELKTVEGR